MSSLRGLTTIELFFSYAKVWRGINQFRLRNFVNEKGSKLKVVLPDPDDNELMEHLAKSIAKKNAEVVRRRILDAVDYFKALKEQAVPEGAEISIFYSNVRPTLAYYRFDNIAVVSLFPMATVKVTVPHFVLSNKGTIFSFLVKQFDTLISPETGNTRKLNLTELT